MANKDQLHGRNKLKDSRGRFVKESRMWKHPLKSNDGAQSLSWEKVA